jgi:ABC-type lipoprotein release transport system permease subunit
MIWAFVFRNITRNKRNSFIMILLIGVITCLFFIGNSVMRKSDQGLRQTYVENITGDIVIQKITDVTMNLFGANTPVIEEYFTIPVLPAYEAVLDEVRSVPGVDAVTSQVSGLAIVDIAGVREGFLLCGLDAATYFSLFPGISITEGRKLEPGEYGVMINEKLASAIEKAKGIRLGPGDPVILTSGSSIGFKIREVPLAGVFSYQSSGLYMWNIVLTDPQTVRALMSVQVASADVDVPDNALALLNNDIDDIFNSPEDTSGSRTDEKGLSVDDLVSILGQENAAAGPVYGGDWNFIIVRVAKGVSASKVMEELNERLLPYGVCAVSWRTAAGVSALLVLLLQALFNGGVVLVSIAGILTIVNLLLIAVFRRTREIGTLRALGASDGYIRILILGENLILSLIAGALGIAAGGILIYVINRMNINVTNELIISLLGDFVVKLAFLPEVACTAFAVAVFVGVCASLYPVQKAVRIEPVVAVRRG